MMTKLIALFTMLSLSQVVFAAEKDFDTCAGEVVSSSLMIMTLGNKQMMNPTARIASKWQDSLIKKISNSGKSNQEAKSIAQGKIMQVFRRHMASIKQDKEQGKTAHQALRTFVTNQNPVLEECLSTYRGGF
jgi:hypothetical protein